MHRQDSTVKREVLWNIIEPGDPYDIKKSTIAKIPGDKLNFMGQHLQIICLLQAAQIQRLCQYLDDYKLKYRQTQRKQLDRHSYEIQIKQLTQQLAEQLSYKNENIKLKQFLKRQNAQVEQLRKKLSSNQYQSVILQKYQVSLNQIQTLMNEVNTIRQENQHFKSQAQQYNSRIYAMEIAKNRQIQELTSRQSQQITQHYEKQRRELVAKFESIISQLEFDNKKFHQLNQIKIHQIEHLNGIVTQLQFELNSRPIQNKSSLQATIQQYQHRFSLLGCEIQRLNILLRQKNSEIENMMQYRSNLEGQYNYKIQIIKQLETKIFSYETQIRSFSIQLQNAENSNNAKLVIEQLQIKVKIQQEEIERLNNALRKKVDENNGLIRRTNEYEFQLKNIEILRRQVQQYKSENKQIQQLRKVNIELQNKIHAYNTQLQRNHQIINLRNTQLENLFNQNQSFKHQIQEFKTKIRTIQFNTNSSWKTQTTLYEQKISKLSKENIQFKIKFQDISRLQPKLFQYENRLSLLSQQIERLNQIIKMKTDEYNSEKLRNVNFQKQLQSYRKKDSSATYKLQTKLSSYEQKINAISLENEQLKARLVDFNNQNKLIIQHQSQIRIVRSQMQRLNQIIYVKIQENNNLITRMRVLEQEKQNYKRRIYEIEVSILSESQHKNRVYEDSNKALLKESMILKQRISELTNGANRIPEYQNKIAMLSQEIERITMNLRIKNDQNYNLQQTIRILQQQLQGNKRSKVTIYEESMRALTRQNEEIKMKIKQLIEYNSKIPQYENRIAIMSQQIQRIKNNRHSDSTSIESKLRFYQQQLEQERHRFLSMEKQIKIQWNQKVAIYEANINQLIQQNQELKRKFMENDSLKTNNNQQFQKLCYNYKIKVDELRNAYTRCQNLQTQLQVYKNKVSEIQLNIQHQWYNKVNIYQSKIYEFTNENEELKRRLTEIIQINKIIPEYENRIALISQEIQRVHSKNKQFNEKYNREVDLWNKKEREIILQLERVNKNLKIKVQQCNKIQVAFNELKLTVKETDIKFKTNDSQYGKLYSAYKLITQQYEASKQNIISYQTSIKRLHTQFERLQLVIVQLKKQNYSYRVQLQKHQTSTERNRFLTNQIERLNLLTQQQKADLEQLRLRLADNLSLEKRIQEHMALTVVLFAEIQSLRNRVKQKEKEVQQVRRSSLAPYKSTN